MRSYAVRGLRISAHLTRIADSNARSVAAALNVVEQRSYITTRFSIVFLDMESTVSGSENSYCSENSLLLLPLIWFVDFYFR